METPADKAKVSVGNRVIFEYKEGDVGEQSDKEKAGKIVDIRNASDRYPIKVRLMNADEDMFTYISTNEILRIIN